MSSSWVVGVSHAELRVGAQEFDEVKANEPSNSALLDDLVHFRPDAGDLPESEFVDFIGVRVVEGGEEAGQVFVVRPAVLQGGCAERGTGSGECARR